MSEKRFEFYSDEHLVGVIDTVTGRTFNSFEIVDCLNEQQSTIQFLQDEIVELKKDIDIYKYEEKKHSESARKLYEENEQLKLKIDGLEFALKYMERQVDEQQDKIQDLEDKINKLPPKIRELWIQD